MAIYCLRVLCAKKHGIEYSGTQINIYNELWIQARNEMARLFQHVCQLPPHYSRETISMNTARQTVLKLARGLTIVAQKLGVS